MYNKPDYFLGSWKINRTCEIKKGKISTIKLRGKATFEELPKDTYFALGTNLLYNEELVANRSITTGASSNHASRQYKYSFLNGIVTKFNQEKSSSSVTYSKMFDLSYLPGTNYQFAQGEYKCGGDLYNCTFFFISLDSFKIVYNVQGPEKNLNIVSTFTRESVEENLEIEISGNNDNINANLDNIEAGGWRLAII